MPCSFVLELIPGMEVVIWVWESCDTWVWAFEVFISGGGMTRVGSLKQGCPTIGWVVLVVMGFVVGCLVGKGSWKA